MKENDFRARCPKCKTPIANWRDLYYYKKYVCGVESCKQLFFLVKSPVEDLGSVL